MLYWDSDNTPMRRTYTVSGMIAAAQAQLAVALRRKFVRDTLALQVGRIANTGISFGSSVLIARLMGPQAYGEWALAASFFAIWQSFNLTGVGYSTITRLSAAVGARDAEEALNLLGFYIKMSLLWAVPCITLLLLLGGTIASRLYSETIPLLSGSMEVGIVRPDAQIGVMAALYALVLIPDAFYNLVVIALQSRRSMRLVTTLQNANAIGLALCVIAALLVSPTLEGMVFGRLLYSYTTVFIALWLYARERDHAALHYPSMLHILRRAQVVAVRPYWRFGVAIALDRNAANLFMQVPQQVIGIAAGPAAAGYLLLALKAIQLPNMLTSAIFDNMQAAVPQAVGRGDFAGLRRNFMQVLVVLAIGAAGFYALFALAMLLIGEWAVTLVYGAQWTPAVPFVVVLAVYGAVTTLGGVFGPMYRALELVRTAILIKIAALLIGLVPGLLLASTLPDGLGGAWMINLLFALSVSMTAWVVLRELERRRMAQIKETL